MRHDLSTQQEEPTRSLLDPLRQVAAPIVRWEAATAHEANDELVTEEPLEVRVRLAGDAADVETVAVILRTPGHDEELAAGFLFSEGLIFAREELAAVEPGMDADGLPSPNLLDVLPAPGLDLAGRIRDGGYSRQFAVNASCGVCGKNTVDAACITFPRLPPGDFTVSPEALYALPERLHGAQRVFHATGGLHGAGLFDALGALLAVREDVGRHNAVDKLIGRALLDGTLPLRERILLVSGRLSFEIVVKALAARISIVAAISAPSSLAVDLARTGGITLAAFLRGHTLNVYSHPERVAR
ncbi:MAG TPA: formate dehydrogenase accessory sulfurtransferase FdhD [Ktedonobacterales bacterium]|jgi:FdhD protein|nr:formate dehydrogenase accessory sulfurtransferase FdhD [Ktedonobacterales bacterium]